MKKNMIAMAVAAAVAAPVAMADTTLYGIAHISGDYIKGADDNFNVQSGSSRLGVKGTEKISDSLSAIYQMEWGVDMTDGEGNGDTNISSRNQFVGLKHNDVGTLIVGRHDTPMKMAISKHDLFGDQIGDNGNIVGRIPGLSAGWNLRTQNTIAYLTPNLSGFSAIVAYVADHDRRLDESDKPNFNDDDNDFDAWSVSANYDFQGMFDITAAYEQHNIASDAAKLAGIKDNEKSWLIGASTNLAGVKINALYQNIEDFARNDSDIYGVGAAYAFGANTIKAHYYYADLDKDLKAANNGKNRKLAAVGYDYALSKQTTVYAAYAWGNDGQSVWGDGHGGKAAVDMTDNNSAVSVGVRHKF